MKIVDWILMCSLLIVIGSVVWVVIYSRKKSRGRDLAEQLPNDENEKASQPEGTLQSGQDINTVKEDLGQLEKEISIRTVIEEECKTEQGTIAIPEEGNIKEEVDSREVSGERRASPDKRGGRSRSSANHDRQKEKNTNSFRLKPEIICWKKERQWMLAVEIPEEISSIQGLEVIEEGLCLLQDEATEDRWCLREALSSHVVVCWENNEVEILSGKEEYLLFKLNGWGSGRRVRYPSAGLYLVMALDSWERDEKLSGLPPVTPEPVSIKNCRAHYFDIQKDNGSRIVFHKPDGTPFEIKPNAPQFEVAGNQLLDACEDKGPLFGSGLLKIRLLGGLTWRNIQTIVVGEEGGGKGKWRTFFSPNQELIEQDMFKITSRKGGWYFLRFYDENDDLVESLDFRFIGGLKDIKMQQPSPFPPESGHGVVFIDLFHESDCHIQAIDNSEGNMMIKRQNNKTILTIPPNPTRDKTCWLVGSNDGLQVEVVILAERVWWMVAEESKIPSHWEDKRLILVRDEFTAISQKAIWIKLPKSRWTNAISVGFEQRRSRRYDLKVIENTVAIPLRDFADSQEVADRMREYSLKIWITINDKMIEGAVAIIPANPPDPSRLAKKQNEPERLFVNLAGVSVPRLCGVLTKLRKVTHGPLRLLIKEVRHKYFKRRRRHRAKPEEFIKQALCVIAFYFEINEDRGHKIVGPKKRWIDRAHRARNEFPEVINRLRNRYEELKVGNAYGGCCNMRDEAQKQ
ncbi:MAG: hypothetical protein KKA52_07115 [Candidatus Omnitrophica bacterium]|nr:hypothetical protein [Candidatus Omnitrophota bacterium]